MDQGEAVITANHFQYHFFFLLPFEAQRLCLEECVQKQLRTEAFSQLCANKYAECAIGSVITATPNASAACARELQQVSFLLFL